VGRSKRSSISLTKPPLTGAFRCKQPKENIMFGFIVDAVTAPLRDTLDVLEGLSEGEFRTRAALRLGTDVVAGMAVSEIIEALKDI
jgi:hypothetical protein